MRSVRDRIRHAVCFEVIGLIIVTPVAAWGFDQPMHAIGLVALVSSLLATAWNYLYNLLFDHAMLRLTGSPRKSVAIRVFHAVLFEFGMLLVLLPFIAWYLGITLLQAFLMDVSFALFYLVYAFVFNWAYDVIFPIPHSAKARV
ncbi:MULTISPECIES: PACE efflux transporter [Limibacillus]|uniref:Putative membrane protein n=1 Tax=Limibacillus halophilus TaxID=1579333 RepID=A0A839SU72_9PROT|nr:PACE efflux transporter [Limibacillus halophilus]MBB3065250.1 putative membrane protein [Limibacillus halophilus]